MGKRNNSRRASRFAGLRRAMGAEHPESVIRDWDGRRKGFGTQTMYLTVAVAIVALLATSAVVVTGFDAAAATIIVGLGVLIIVAWLAPPARVKKTAVGQIQVGDFVATSLENDFVIHAAPVVAITTVRRANGVVTQVATASGAAYETDGRGSLPVVQLVGFRPARPRVFSADAVTADRVGHWAWTPVVAEVIGRLLPNQRDGLPTPTRDQVRADLVARMGCTPATARYALQAATGLGLVTHTATVSATPAGAVWFSSRWNGVGSRIDAPAKLPRTNGTAPATAPTPAPAISVIDRSVRVPDDVADVSDQATVGRTSDAPSR